jgi:phosphoenolpyruvate synthase/pyruvate phosphate dikinase
MQLLKSKDPIALKVAAGNMTGASGELKADLVGQVGSLGVAEGPACVVLSTEQLSEVKQGDILVAANVWQSWSPVFALIKGAVVDRGGVLSNAATLGREYGIPVVINVISGTSNSNLQSR